MISMRLIPWPWMNMAFISWPPMSRMKDTSRIALGGGAPMGQGFDDTHVQVQCRPNQIFSITGDRPGGDGQGRMIFRYDFFKPFQTFKDGFHRFTAVIAVVVEDHAFGLIDDHDFGRGGAGIDTQIQWPMGVRIGHLGNLKNPADGTASVDNSAGR